MQMHRAMSKADAENSTAAGTTMMMTTTVTMTMTMTTTMTATTPSSRWTKLASEFVHASPSSGRKSAGTGPSPTMAFELFSWEDIAFSSIKAKRKSNDLCAVLLAEKDRSVAGQRDPARHFMSKYTDDEKAVQDLLVNSASHWLLSTSSATSAELSRGITGIAGDIAELPWNADHRTIVLLPWNEQESLPMLSHVHHLIRELVVGLYVFNQTPELDLASDFERSTACQLSLAYRDTSIGQAMIDVAYAAACLRCGAHFDADSRRRFVTEWRTRLSVDRESGRAETKRQILPDFMHFGLQDVTRVAGYEGVYDGLSAECLCPPACESSDFQTYKQSAAIDLHFFVKEVRQHMAIFLMEPEVDVVGRVAKWTDSITDTNDIQEHLLVMSDVIRRKLHLNDAVHDAIRKLKIVACLLPLLVGLRHRQKIPNLAYLCEAMPRDSTQTERELPPLMCGDEFVNRRYYEAGGYFGLRGGVRIGLESPPTSRVLPDSFDEATLARINVILDESETSETSDEVPDGGRRLLPTVQIGDQTFCIIELKLENFVAKNCRKPHWANQLYVESSRLTFQILPLTSAQLNERFRTAFGPHCSSVYDDVHRSVHEASEAKMASVVHALLRDIHSDRLELQSDDGWSAVHSAVLNDAVYVVGQFLQIGLNVHARRFMYNKTSEFGEPLPDVDCTGPTALHLAARFGAAQTCTLLLASAATTVTSSDDVGCARDDRGWAPIHYACFYGQTPVVRLLLFKQKSHIELTTDDRLASTPLLLCATSGALDTMKWLLANGCRADVIDADGRNIVHLATLHARISVLEHLVVHGCKTIHVWRTLSEMMKCSDEQWLQSAVRCVGVLMTRVPHCFQDISDASLPDQLVSLLCEDAPAFRRSQIVTTLSTMSHLEDVQRCFVQVAPLKILVKMMNSEDDLVACSKAVAIISDGATTILSKDVIGEHHGFAALYQLLAKSSGTELTLCVLKAIKCLCEGHRANKDRICTYNFIPTIVSLLHSRIDEVRLKAGLALKVLADGHSVNQKHVVSVPKSLDAVRQLLLEQWKPALQMTAAELLRVLAECGGGGANNHSAANRLLFESDVVAPTIGLLKGLDLQLRERAALALWAIAGTGSFQRKIMARKIGTVLLIDMLMSKSEILVGTCCPLISAVVYEDVDEQNKFVGEGGLSPLLRLVCLDSSPCILEDVMRTLSTLCLGVDYGGNRKVQAELSRQQLLQCLLPLLGSCQTPIDGRVQAEALRLIACLIINRSKEVDITVLADLGSIVNGLLRSEDQEIRLRAGEAVALFAYDHAEWTMWRRDGVEFSAAFFDHFLKSNDERWQCTAAHLIAILGSMVRDMDKASCAVIGTELLVSKVRDTDDDDVFILAVSRLCSLARGRSGVANTLVALGLIELLLQQLCGDNGEDSGCGDGRSAKSASALANLSHHRMARQRLLSNCRRRPDLYDALVSRFPRVRLSSNFVQEFEAARRRGIPSEWWVKHYLLSNRA